MLEELNELMESIIIDIASEGICTTKKTTPHKDKSQCGSHTLLNGLLTLLSSAV